MTERAKAKWWAKPDKVAERLMESLMDQVSIGQVAEGLADQMAESLAESLDVDVMHSWVAEALAHLGGGPDEIKDLIHTILTGLAASVALKLTRGPLPEGMPVDAADAMGRVKTAAKAREVAMVEEFDPEMAGPPLQGVNF